MLPRISPIICLLVVIAVDIDTRSTNGAESSDQPASSTKSNTEQVKVKDITLKVPTAWKRENPKSGLRLAQFRIPAVKGDKADAELAIFSFGRSDVAANVRRWINQFEPEGRVVSISTGEATLGKYVFVELSANHKNPSKRVLAVILLLPEKGTYFFKMVGPDKTVRGQTNSIREAFGGDVGKEKQVTLDSLEKSAS